MTRGQYTALLLIGAVAAVAFFQSYEVARYLRAVRSGGGLGFPKETTV